MKLYGNRGAAHSVRVVRISTGQNVLLLNVRSEKLTENNLSS